MRFGAAIAVGIGLASVAVMAVVGTEGSTSRSALMTGALLVVFLGSAWLVARRSLWGVLGVGICLGAAALTIALLI